MKIPVFDGHNDTLLSLLHPRPGMERSFFERSEYGHIDLPRAQAGGLGAGFFAIFTPNPFPSKRTAPYPGSDKKKKTYEWPLPAPLEQTYALNFTLRMADKLFALERKGQGTVKVTHTLSEIEICLQNDTLAIIFHIEGAEAIDTDLISLSVLYEAGLRSLGLVWSRPTAFGFGVPFKFPATPDIGPGLTEAGKALVKACNELGILIDLSHLNEKGFWDVEKLSQAPLVATHSGAHACSASPRNLLDKQLDAVRASGGVAGVNFHAGFLRADGISDPETTSLSEIVRHVDYMVERMGIEHVALGSDFDGATMPGDLKDVAGLPKLLTALREAGYDDSALRKIAYENWMRVLGETWV